MKGTLLMMEAELCILMKNQAILILFYVVKTDIFSPEAQTNIFSSTFLLCHQLLILILTRYVSYIVFFLSARSIVNKISELEEYVFEYNPDVIICQNHGLMIQ